MTWICRRGFRHTALLRRFEFCRGLPLCFGFVRIKLPLLPFTKMSLLPAALLLPHRLRGGCPGSVPAQIWPQALGPDPWDNSPGDFPAVSTPLSSVRAVCAFPITWSWDHSEVSAGCWWTLFAESVWLWEPVGPHVSSGNPNGDADISLLVWCGPLCRS